MTKANKRYFCVALYLFLILATVLSLKFFGTVSVKSPGSRGSGPMSWSEISEALPYFFVMYGILILIINIILRQKKRVIDRAKSNIKSDDPVLDEIIQEALQSGKKEGKNEKEDEPDRSLETKENVQ